MPDVVDHPCCANEPGLIGACPCSCHGQLTITMTDPVTISVIAERLGVTPPAVGNWTARHNDFPPPLIDLPRTRVWDWVDVRAWAEQHGKMP